MMICFNLSLCYGIGAHINNLMVQGFFMVVVVLFGQRIPWFLLLFILHETNLSEKKKSLK
jgi:hypothetical protein